MQRKAERTNEQTDGRTDGQTQRPIDPACCLRLTARIRIRRSDPGRPTSSPGGDLPLDPVVSLPLDRASDPCRMPPAHCLLNDPTSWDRGRQKRSMHARTHARRPIVRSVGARPFAFGGSSRAALTAASSRVTGFHAAVRDAQESVEAIIAVQRDVETTKAGSLLASGVVGRRRQCCCQ